MSVLGKRKRAQSYMVAIDGPMLEVTVELDTWTVPWGVLAHHSSYFRGLMNPSFEEGISGEVTLENTSSKIWSSFLCWVYFGKLYDEKAVVNREGKDEERTSVNLTQDFLCKLWIFGDMRGIPGLQNAALAELWKHLCETGSFATGALNTTYERTMPTSKLRAFWVEFTVMRGSWDMYSPMFQKKPEDGPSSVYWPREFLLDVCSRQHQLSDCCAHRRGLKDDWGKIDVNLSQFQVPEDRWTLDDEEPVLDYD